MIKRFSDTILKHRLKVIVTTLLVVLFFAYFLKDLGIEGSYRIWFGEDSEVLQEYDSFSENYSPDTAIVIGFKDEKGVFTPENIAMIREIESALESVENIVFTVSLTSYKDVSVDPQTKDLNVSDFIDPENTDPVYLQERASSAHSTKLIGTLLSSDLKSTLIVGKITKVSAGSEEMSFAIMDEVHKILEPYVAKGVRFYIVGQPVINTEFVKIAKTDGAFFVALSIIMVVILLGFFLKSYIGAILPTTVVLFSVVITLSIQVLLGYRINSFTANIPIFAIGVGIVPAVHLYWVWVLALKEGKTSLEAVEYALTHTFKPIFISSLAAAIGFASLGASNTIPIVTLGIATGTASLLTFAITVTFLPAMLSYFHPKSESPTEIHLIDPKKFTRFVIANDKKILMIFAVVFMFFVVGLFKTHVDNNAIRYFQDDHEFRKAMDFVTDEITGPMRYELLVDTKVADGIKEPQFIQLVVDFGVAYKKEFSQIRSVTSVADAIVEINKALNNQEGVPSSKESVGQYLLLYSMSLPPNIGITESMDVSAQHIRISCNVNNGQTSQDIKMMAWAKEWWKNKGYEAKFYGQTPMFSKMHDDVTNTLIYSMMSSIVLISILMFFVLRSGKLILLFLIPNIFPIITALGTMGWLGLSIDLGVAISAAIIFGIAVDDTIHYFDSYLGQRKIGKSLSEAIESVMDHVGGATILTTMIFIISFGVLGFSSFNPNVYFAITTTLSLLVASFAELFVIPAIFSYMDRKKGV